MQDLITILGPTACGKTAVATLLAARLGRAEIISADSRQVFRGMDIGTGKDLGKYGHIPYHLIDIAEAGTKYSVFEFQRDFLQAYKNICSRACIPILCGGTGLYIESVLRAYKLVEVPVNMALRQELEGKSLEELTALLSTYKRLHNTTDVDSCQRAIRAIEIEMAADVENLQTDGESTLSSRTEVDGNGLVFGIQIDREERRRKITARLKQRLEHGMIEEVKGLLDEGIPADDLIYYGLEYKFVTEYLKGQTTYDEMFTRLDAIIFLCRQRSKS